MSFDYAQETVLNWLNWFLGSAWEPMSRGSASLFAKGKFEAEPPDLRYQAEPGNEYEPLDMRYHAEPGNE